MYALRYEWFLLFTLTDINAGQNRKLLLLFFKQCSSTKSFVHRLCWLSKDLLAGEGDGTFHG